MSENSSNPTAFDAVCDRLRAASSLLLVTHARPDGDGLGSMAALHRAATAAAKAVRMLVPDEVPERYDFLFPSTTPAGASRFGALAEDVDAIVVLDTCAGAQLDGLVEGLAARRADVVVIDHHQTFDGLGEAEWIDSTAAATAVMVGEVLEALDWPVDATAAEALLTAALTDTGWLRYANADPRCLRAVANWLAKGVRPDGLYQKIYQTDRPERLKLLGVVLESLEFHADGRLAVMLIRGEDFAGTGARPDETENMINEAFRVGEVEVSVLLVENADGARVSLRSRNLVDVSAIANRYGGGGHARAAGVRLAEPVDIAKDRIVRDCIEALAERK